MAENTGSFGAPIQGASELKALLAARGAGGVGATQVQSPTSAGAPPTPQPISSIESAQAAIPAGAVSAPQPQQAAPTEVPPTDPELSIAIKALGSFVTTMGNTRRDAVKARTQGII